MSTPRPLFRPSAVRRYAETGGRAAPYRPVAPRSAPWFGLILALLAAGIAVLGAARLPVHAGGPAVVVGGDRAVAMLPPGETGRVRAGQSVTVELPGGGRAEGRVGEVLPGVLDAGVVGRRFGLGPGAAGALGGPGVAVLVRLGPGGDAAPGGAGRAEVEVGSRRVAALLPLVGRVFGG